MENPQAFLNHQRDDALKGMTLRDWHANQALPGVIHHYYGDHGEEDIAFMSYKIADSMLAERSKQQ